MNGTVVNCLKCRPATVAGEIKTGSKCFQLFYPWDACFDYFFMGSQSSTALNQSGNVAEPGTLHETEFIRPFTRAAAGDEPVQVYLAGDIWVDDDGLPGWRDVLQSIQLGGERGYGWGRMDLAVALVEEKLLKEHTPNELPGSEKDDNGPEIVLTRDERIPAHVRASVGMEKLLQGHLEPLTGWERNNSGRGNAWRVSEPVITFAPGAVVKGERVVLGIDREYGVWFVEHGE
ncbi:hypothetical protein [Desulfotomaculum copahuensis]|uniref:Uncharacterized protein n=1 Tax=Desulfotomaculum copahuensis TaxID=1838280 RepID=A0A1B7LDN7_9FIRM|nr:hypothetical protein [Desulfotomaculum copahuensis]OAT81210.1 hypothetical protein A6M21_11360 [Desulfotomaculum copahuensis]